LGTHLLEAIEIGVAASSSLQDPKWQCVDKNNCTLPVRDGKEGEERENP
jgi:hypothetical protein